MSQPTKKILLDCDPGIDDALAILLALASPEIDLQGITVVHGNCSVEQGTRNALNLLQMADSASIPICKGYTRPLVEEALFAPETHGPTGLGYAVLPEANSQVDPRHAVEFLREQIHNSPGELTIAAVGPLTNIAGAVRMDPDIIPKIQELVIMGGAILHSGNTTPLAEFNVFADPHAAHIVFHSGIPIRLVPLDVTYQCLLTLDDVHRIQQISSPISQFIADSTRFYMEFHDSYQDIQGCIINDPLALALIFQPGLCEYQSLYVDVDYSPGISLGKTLADFYDMKKKPANLQVALKVQARKFLDSFVERMLELQLSKGGE